MRSRSFDLFSGCARLNVVLMFFNSMSLINGFAWIQASAEAKKMTFAEC